MSSWLAKIKIEWMFMLGSKFNSKILYRLFCWVLYHREENIKTFGLLFLSSVWDESAKCEASSWKRMFVWWSVDWPVVLLICRFTTVYKLYFAITLYIRLYIASFGWDVKPRSSLCSTQNMDYKDPDIIEKDHLLLPAHKDCIHLEERCIICC